MWRKALVIGLVLMAIGMVVGGAITVEVSNASYYLSAASACWSAAHGDLVGVGFGIAGILLTLFFPPSSAAVFL
ncbi:hypothetical protein [Pyrococcus sp. NA2]|uniref:hypothetical protein n=1 Tax=Pyrococcus sp. (strain NA2) TaxID=342949 RepID=UPI00064FEF3F|nr:hypothetical protein [Pyrococcus sp. NA2]